jgi:hypothetical protein
MIHHVYQLFFDRYVERLNAIVGFHERLKYFQKSFEYAFDIFFEEFTFLSLASSISKLLSTFSWSKSFQNFLLLSRITSSRYCFILS